MSVISVNRLALHDETINALFSNLSRPAAWSAYLLLAWEVCACWC